MRALLLLTSLTLSTFLSAQDYEHFIQPDARWMVNWDLTSTIWDTDYFYENVFGADTLINDTLYTIVWLNHYARTGEPGGFETIIQPFQPGFQNELVGFVREDTLLQRVYFRDFDNGLTGPEILLYDFELQLGDVFYDELVDSGPYTVVQLGTQFVYGAERQVWTLGGGRTIIEGIGSDLGPFEGITDLISGGIPVLHTYCNGPAMDCHVAVDGLVNNRRQISLQYTIPDFEGPWTQETRVFRFQDTVHLEGHVFWQLDGPSEDVFFRQDGAKVYRYHTEYDGEEVLLYDFELEGLVNYLYESDYPMEFSVLYDVAGQSTFELDNGEERNSVIILSGNPQAPWQETVEWVDGIGDIENPLFPEEYLTPYFDIINSRLVCFWDDYEDDPIYRSPNFVNCEGDVVDNTTEAPLQTYQLYPNPTSSIIAINMPMEGKQIVLLDILGHLVISFENSNELDLSILPSGTYFYQILEKDGLLLQSGKLIKQ